ncbi:MAG: hypothetical protein LUG93_15595 [Lachnospiraceae bacterium]|nr:hypothetical protein [Lachnospiraceae bacterium]
MNTKRRGQIWNGKKKGQRTRESIGQLFRMILYTSVTWNLLICRILSASGIDKRLDYIGLSVLFALGIAIISALYGMLGAGKILYGRYVYLFFFLFTFNILMLMVIWVRKGTDSFLFRSGVILVVLSIVVYFVDLFSFLHSFLGWKSLRQKKESQKTRVEKKTDSLRASAKQNDARVMALPDGILKKNTRVFWTVYAVGAILFVIVFLRINPLTIEIRGVLIPLVLLLFPVFFALSGIGYRVQIWALNREKYFLHKLDEEKIHE